MATKRREKGDRTKILFLNISFKIAKIVLHFISLWYQVISLSKKDYDKLVIIIYLFNKI